ncbi:MAG: TIGR00645 family protein [Acidisphaera sp.]|nr:TIGR00645 family protein [Acidisphaera sp.]MBV9811178.1 TIGR00645 family protein [Acetobacteraceae bacterium]
MSGRALEKTRAERSFERLLFAGRWLMVPFYLGLLVTLAILLFRFALDLVEAVLQLPNISDKDATLVALRLIDLTLVANLLLIVTFAGYENFVSRMDTIGESDRAAWMGKIDFGAMKVKLVSSTVAISAIYLLSVLLNIGDADRVALVWILIVQGALVVSALALAVIDRIGTDHR